MGSRQGPVSFSKQSHPAILTFLLTTPIVGLVLCIQVLRSVHAAFDVLTKHLLPERAVLVVEINRVAGTTFAQLGPDRLTDFIHIVHFEKIPKYNAVNVLKGYRAIEIFSPSQVIDYGDS